MIWCPDQTIPNLIPTLLRCTLQVNGGALPSHVVPYCAVAAVLAALLPIAAFFISRASAQYQQCPAAAKAKVSFPTALLTCKGFFNVPRHAVDRKVTGPRSVMLKLVGLQRRSYTAIVC